MSFNKANMNSNNLNAVEDVADGNGDNKLPAYQNAKSKAIIAASLLIPFGTVAFFVWLCQSQGEAFSLDASVKVGVLQRVALIVHGIYFLCLPFCFELMIEKLPLPFGPEKYRFGKVPKRPDNLYWMMTCLSGELFFVGAAIFLLMASQADVPRWSLILPIAQCSYNMKNDLLWVGFGNIFSPVQKRMTIMTLDWILIGACMAVYVHHFFTA